MKSCTIKHCCYICLSVRRWRWTSAQNRHENTTDKRGNYYYFNI